MHTRQKKDQPNKQSTSNSGDPIALSDSDVLEINTSKPVKHQLTEQVQQPRKKPTTKKALSSCSSVVTVPDTVKEFQGLHVPTSTDMGALIKFNEDKVHAEILELMVSCNIL